jgi:hypothetical protein
MQISLAASVVLGRKFAKITSNPRRRSSEMRLRNSPRALSGIRPLVRVAENALAQYSGGVGQTTLMVVSSPGSTSTGMFRQLCPSVPYHSPDRECDGTQPIYLDLSLGSQQEQLLLHPHTSSA